MGEAWRRSGVGAVGGDMAVSDRFVEMQVLHTTVLQEQTPDGLVEAQGRRNGDSYEWQVSGPYWREALIWSGTTEQVKTRLASEIDRRKESEHG